MNYNLNQRNGFTLIELLMAMAIISIFATILTPNLLNARSVAVENSSFAYTRSCVTAMTAYALDNPELSLAGLECNSPAISSGELPEYMTEAKLNDTSDAVEYKFMLKGTETNGSIPIFLN